MKPIKKLPLILPIIIILFSFALAPMHSANAFTCDCSCNGKYQRTIKNVADKSTADGKCQEICGEDKSASCPENVTTTNKEQKSTQSGVVTISDPLRIGDPAEFYARIVSALLGFVGIASLITFVYAGFMFLISAGNSERVKKAKDTMLYAIIGIIVSIASYAILSFIFKTLEGATGQ